MIGQRIERASDHQRGEEDHAEHEAIDDALGGDRSRRGPAGELALAADHRRPHDLPGAEWQQHERAVADERDGEHPPQGHRMDGREQPGPAVRAHVERDQVEQRVEEHRPRRDPREVVAPREHGEGAFVEEPPEAGRHPERGQEREAVSLEPRGASHAWGPRLPRRLRPWRAWQSGARPRYGRPALRTLEKK